jgi:hypothetical protein
MVGRLMGQRLGGRITVNKSKFMGGWEGASKRDTNVSLFVVHFIKYFIFKCKQRRRFPLLLHALEEFWFAVEHLKKTVKWREPLEHMRVIIQELVDGG